MRRLKQLAIVGLALLAHANAGAQALPGPRVDEDKLPEWIKRQAKSPFKVIIESSPLRAKAAVPAKAADAGAKTMTAKASVATKPAAPITAAPLPAAPAVALAPSVEALATPSRAAADGPAEPVAKASVPAEPLADVVQVPAEAPPLLSAALTTPVTMPQPAQAPLLDELRLIKRIDPQVPPRVQESLAAGAKVVVAFTVKPDGSVVDAAVASSTNTALNRPTLVAVKAWRFEPISAAREHSVAFSFVPE